MQRYIAFLRAINVGGRTVRMEELRAVFASLGFSNVATFIASGNVIFDSGRSDAAALEGQVETHLKQSLGYEVATFLRTPAELAAIARHTAFPSSELQDGASLYIAFLHEPPTAEGEQKLMGFRTDVDDFHVHGREVYWLCKIKMSESAFSGALLERTLGTPATLRNVSTINKLVAKYPAAS